MKSEAAVAKNYLTPDELDILNRIVASYLELAELQALGRKPMYMSDWVAKLDDFLKLSGRELLTHPGTVSREQALTKARLEYEEYRARRINARSPVEDDFEKAIKLLPKPESAEREKP